MKTLLTATILAVLATPSQALEMDPYKAGFAVRSQKEQEARGETYSWIPKPQAPTGGTSWTTTPSPGGFGTYSSGQIQGRPFNCSTFGGYTNCN